MMLKRLSGLEAPSGLAAKGGPVSAPASVGGAVLWPSSRTMSWGF